MLSAETDLQYRSVVESVGLLDRRQQAKLVIEGPDRVEFTHSMISHDVRELSVRAGRYATFLTAHGRMITDFFIYKLEERFLVDIDSGRSAEFSEVLQRYIIMDDVTVDDVSSEWGHFGLQGPGTAELLRRVFGSGLPAEALQMADLKWKGADGWLIRHDYLADTGCEVILPSIASPAAKEEVERVGESLGLSQIGAEALEVLRLERGFPRFGVDMDQSNYPMEARLQHAYSLTKGCFIGQEVVAKATHVGGVNRLLCRLLLEGSHAPAAGSEIRDESGKKIGHITSAVFSPRVGSYIALGYLRRVHASAGSSVVVEQGTGHISAHVVNSFLDLN